MGLSLYRDLTHLKAGGAGKDNSSKIGGIVKRRGRDKLEEVVVIRFGLLIVLDRFVDEVSSVCEPG